MPTENSKQTHARRTLKGIESQTGKTAQGVQDAKKKRHAPNSNATTRRPDPGLCSKRWTICRPLSTPIPNKSDNSIQDWSAKAAGAWFLEQMAVNG
ncbi:hypothetical protein GO003_015140 [Methylicorpusculum oleiharenae]|uniref:hypothetical protein n=1 Tax=Methylicorpusculum oleiharenae TaxID=1338687 RepID=UPI0013567DCA|nr:hypothetical protein [Methylicorpusculum oleiharenae]MCD2451725.1 hypothetical protein [Methylicorpusculum oleiharenae]